MSEHKFEIVNWAHSSWQSHDHRNFELVLLTHGSGTCKTETLHYFLSPGHLCLIWPRHYHVMDFCPDANGFALSFSPEFLNLSLVLPYTPCGSLHVTGGLPTSMIDLAALLEWEYDNPGPFQEEILRGLLKLFFLQLHRQIKQLPQSYSEMKHQIVHRFLTLLEQKFVDFRSSADFASALSVTTSYLNETIKKVSGFPTTYHIHQRVVAEAKRLALHSTQSMKQVAYVLGFDDVCHFSRYFKKASGESFTQFRQRFPITEI